MGCRWQKAIHFEIIIFAVLSRKWAYTGSFILDTLCGCDRITFTHSVNVMSKNVDEMLASGRFLTLNDKLLKRFLSNGKLALQVIMSKANLKN